MIIVLRHAKADDINAEGVRFVDNQTLEVVSKRASPYHHLQEVIKDNIVTLYDEQLRHQQTAQALSGNTLPLTDVHTSKLVYWFEQAGLTEKFVLEHTIDDFLDLLSPEERQPIKVCVSHMLDKLLDEEKRYGEVVLVTSQLFIETMAKYLGCEGKVKYTDHLHGFILNDERTIRFV